MSGRTPKWTDADFAEVTRLISEGAPLSEAWGGSRPGKTAYWKKLQESPEHARAHEFAMQMRAQARIAKIESIVEKLEVGRIDPASARTAIDALKWLSQKEDPKRYSDVQRQELSGSGGKDLFPEQVTVSDFELARHVAYILGKAERAAVLRGDLVALPESAP